MRQVSATELAKMGKCERQAFLDYHYGENKSLTTTYIQKGNDAHEKFYRRLSGQDKRCFIATAVFGEDAPETNKLRIFRDEKLLPYKAGRIFVKIYYAVSPKFVIGFKKYPCLRPPVRIILLWVLKKLM